MPSITKKTRNIVASAVLLSSVASIGNAWSAECKKMIVSGSEQYAPSAWRDREDPERIAGVNVTLVQMAMADTGVQVVSKYMGSWKQVQEAAKTGSVDLIAGIYSNEERKTFLEFVTPAGMKDPTVVFVRKGKTFPFKKVDDLRSRVGASRAGNSYGKDFDDYAPKLNIHWMPKIELAFTQLAGDKVDYVVFGLYPGLAAIELEGWRDKFEVLPQHVTSEGLHLGISKASPCVKYKEHLDKKMAQYVKDGTVQKLVDQHMALWRHQTSKLKVGNVK